MQIVKDSVVSMHYRVATAEGEHIDASQPDQPLVYIAGHEQIIKGLDQALLGKSVGDKLDVVIPPADAYGEPDEALNLVVSKSAFPKDAHKQIAPGFRFRADHPQRDGEMVMFTVFKVEGDEVFVSGNHQLAGKTLHFHVEVTDLRQATADEIAHGHVHGHGCNH
jgi:FKBP-type peptidyl-prolyl cis-trans isomerase SlyD